jgi:hypothetical protein
MSMVALILSMLLVALVRKGSLSIPRAQGSHPKWPSLLRFFGGAHDRDIG